MLGSPNQRIRMPISPWLNINSLSVHSEDKGTQTKDKMTKGNVAIGKPERHVRKASHCGSKQQ